MMRILTSWIGAVALAGCVGGNGDPADAEPPARAVSLDPALTTFAERARDDLADRLGRSAEEIRIERGEFVTWRNGALGCPEPGMAYTEALVPGYRIVLSAAGERYDYHGARGRAPFHCPPERLGKPGPLPDRSTKPDVI